MRQLTDRFGAATLVEAGQENFDVGGVHLMKSQLLSQNPL
jgi:hypothetical protein